MNDKTETAEPRARANANRQKASPPHPLLLTYTQDKRGQRGTHMSWALTLATAAVSDKTGRGGKASSSPAKLPLRLPLLPLLPPPSPPPPPPPRSSSCRFTTSGSRARSRRAGTTARITAAKERFWANLKDLTWYGEGGVGGWVGLGGRRERRDEQ